MTKPPPFDLFRAEMLAKARAIARLLPPDGEWMPALLLDTPSGLAIVDLSRLLTEHAEDKLLPGLIVERRARLAARVQGAWLGRGVEYLQRRLLGEAAPVGREEHVVVVIADSSRAEVHSARVIRSPVLSPNLGPWKQLEVVNAPSVALMQQALRRVRT